MWTPSTQPNFLDHIRLIFFEAVLLVPPASSLSRLRHTLPPELRPLRTRSPLGLPGRGPTIQSRARPTRNSNVFCMVRRARSPLLFRGQTTRAFTTVNRWSGHYLRTRGDTLLYEDPLPNQCPCSPPCFTSSNEAEYFVSCIFPFIGRSILVLESGLFHRWQTDCDDHFSLQGISPDISPSLAADAIPGGRFMRHGRLGNLVRSGPVGNCRSRPP